MNQFNFWIIACISINYLQYLKATKGKRFTDFYYFFIYFIYTGTVCKLWFASCHKVLCYNISLSWLKKNSMLLLYNLIACYSNLTHYLVISLLYLTYYLVISCYLAIQHYLILSQICSFKQKIYHYLAISCFVFLFCLFCLFST